MRPKNGDEDFFNARNASQKGNVQIVVKKNTNLFMIDSIIKACGSTLENMTLGLSGQRDLERESRTPWRDCSSCSPRNPTLELQDVEILKV